MLDPIIRSDLEILRNKVDLRFFESKRTLITGGAGFIGSWLCDVLVQADSVISCVDNLSTGLPENIQHLATASNFAFQKLDVTEFKINDEKYDLIAHFASHASPEDYQQHPVETLAVNSQGTWKMLELARRNDAAVLYASTSEVYGDAGAVPTPEEYWGNVNPIGLRSCYDEGKRFGEALCMAYHRAYDLDVRILRLFNTYGPRLRSDGLYGRAVSKFIKQALTGSDITVHGKGDQTRSFCYVTDCLGAILLAATRKEIKGEVVNIGNPSEVPILQLAEKIKTISKSKSKITFHPRPPDDPQRRCPDISKAYDILHWSPVVKLDDGLRKTIEWFTQRMPP